MLRGCDTGVHGPIAPDQVHLKNEAAESGGESLQGSGGEGGAVEVRT